MRAQVSVFLSPHGQEVEVRPIQDTSSVVVSIRARNEQGYAGFEAVQFFYDSMEEAETLSEAISTAIENARREQLMKAATG